MYDFPEKAEGNPFVCVCVPSNVCFLDSEVPDTQTVVRTVVQFFDLSLLEGTKKWTWFARKDSHLTVWKTEEGKSI